jgi:hypothetical protein
MPGWAPIFPADQVQLGFLGLIEVLSVLPVGAGVIKAFIEHRLVKVIAEVVMLLSHLWEIWPGIGG